MKINKIEQKTTLKSISFELPTELIETMSALDQRLENHPGFEGSLEWDADIKQGITAAVEKRKNTAATPTSKYRVKLPVDVIDEIKADNHFDWNKKVTRIVKSLVTKNGRELDELFQESEEKFTPHVVNDY